MSITVCSCGNNSFSVETRHVVIAVGDDEGLFKAKAPVHICMSCGQPIVKIVVQTVPVQNTSVHPAPGSIPLPTPEQSPPQQVQSPAEVEAPTGDKPA